MRIRFIICAATLALVAGACGTDEATTVVEPTGTEAARDAPADAADAAAQDESSTSSAAPPDNGTVDRGRRSPKPERLPMRAPPTRAPLPVPALAGPGDVPDLHVINMHTGDDRQSPDSGDGPDAAAVLVLGAALTGLPERGSGP